VSSDYYSILSVSRGATQDQLKRAYREAALRLHPDKNVAPGDTELFLDVSRAYETLIDPEQRAAYDRELEASEIATAADASFLCEVQHSRTNLLQLPEPQVHYVMLDVQASPHIPETRSPINLAIIVDHSTSMRGARLDQVRTATLNILKGLQPDDSASVVAFSDRADMVVPSEIAKDIPSARARLSLLQADGGTEIGQGLVLGFNALRENFAENGVNHMILLTDGRTYGDEDLCIALADKASEAGVSINCVGIGSDWSDRLLDDLAGRSGGNVVFLNSPQAIDHLLKSIFTSLSQVVASRVRLEGSIGQQVDLRSAYRLSPEPMPMGDNLPFTLGHLQRNEAIRIILELVIHSTVGIEALTLAHFSITGEILSPDVESSSLPVLIDMPVTTEPDPNPPPPDIVAALNLIGLYDMQEKARHESELGQSAQAAKRLENLATRLIASGERDLAKAALSEAVRLSQSNRISSAGEKALKYGTRALLLPSPRKNGS
jgi:Ca-activated chloride channel family protein